MQIDAARVDIRMIAGMSHLCCSVGVVTISTDKGNSAIVNVLVVCGKSLEFDED